MKQQIRSAGLLFLTAVIWGVAFVAQSVGMDYIRPFTFNGVRCILGGMVLLPYLFFLKKLQKNKPIFNIADIFVLLGALIIVLQTIFQKEN